MGLEIKHLAPYLPYHLKVISDQLVHNKSYEMVLSNRSSSFSNGLTMTNILEFKAKPVLKPFAQIRDIVDAIIYRFNKENIKQVEKIEFNNLCGFVLFGLESDDGCEVGMPYWAYEMVFEGHYDVFGLIPEKLAVDKATLMTSKPKTEVRPSLFKYFK